MRILFAGLKNLSTQDIEILKVKYYDSEYVTNSSLFPPTNRKSLSDKEAAENIGMELELYIERCRDAERHLQKEVNIYIESNETLVNEFLAQETQGKIDAIEKKKMIVEMEQQDENENRKMANYLFKLETATINELGFTLEHLIYCAVTYGIPDRWKLSQ